MTKTLLGVFDNRERVEEAIDKLHAHGLNPKDFSIVMKDKRQADEISESTGTTVGEGAVAGATTGAAIGGLTGLLAGTVLPGLGGLLIAGPIGVALGLTGAAATTVSGAATGAIAGGLIGALMGMGMSEDDAQRYESHVREGAILLFVPARDAQMHFVRDVFAETNAMDIKMIEMAEEANTTRAHDAQSHAHYAQMGAKGGSSTRRSTKGDGRGWHGDPKGHAKAGKGHTVRSRK